MRTSELTRYSILAVVAIIGVLGLTLWDTVFEDVDAGEIAVFQHWRTGKITIHRSPGLKTQNFARVTKYNESYQYNFEAVGTTFDDKGGATMDGNLRWDMPKTDAELLELHNKFGSKGGEMAIERELIGPAIARSIFMTGPLMSSTESAAERRSDIIRYVTDQAVFGVYDTVTRDTVQVDPITQETKTRRIAEIVEDSNSPNGYKRQEVSTVTEFGIRLSNLTFVNITYDKAVQDQIERQREITTEVQVAVAAAVKAEQDAITAKLEGEALAAKARAEQEVAKATAVTAAEKELEVARLARQTAEENKAAAILRGQGEAEAKRLVFNADGALSQKLDAFVRAQEVWATAFANSKHPNVPSVVMGGGSTPNAVNAVQDLATIQMMQMARELDLDLSKAGN